MRKIGASGATGDLRDSILCLNRNSKFITHLCGRDHRERPLCTSTADSNVAMAEKQSEEGATPPVPHSLVRWQKNKHFYGDTFHTLSHGVKGLGSAGEPANWISAHVAIARFCNLKALRKKINTHTQKRKRSKAAMAQMLSRCAVIRNMSFCD